MALEGSLKEFNVADILQLIFFQKKTGVLMMQGRYDKVRVLFHDGNIVGADSRTRNQDRRLVWILARRGIITQDQLDEAVAKAKSEGGKFIHYLVADGTLTKEDVQGIYTFLINEIMVRVFSMKEGRYEFKPQAIPLDKELGVVLNTEHFLMEGVRLMDEWSEIDGRITLEGLFVRDEEAEVKLDEEGERVIPFVDGVMTVTDLSDITGMDSFTVASTLLKLEEKGAVYRFQEEEEQEVVEKPRKRARPIPYLSGVLGALMVLLFIASAVFYFNAPGGMQAFRASEQLYGLRLEVLSNFYSAGSYPASISATDPWGGAISYGRGGEGFVLFSLGHDKTPGTGDDVR
jgi:hypothetical protein